jgi:16S rRNA (cytidine1402-2'-O)-methyltransferase
MDAPYRLAAILEDVEKVFGNGLQITLAMDLTLPGETILRGSVREIRKRVGPRKAEFILFLHPQNR